MSTADKKDRLSDKQRRFVDEYIVDCNTQRAAVAAGYTKQSSFNGRRLLASKDVQQAIKQRMDELKDACFVNRAFVEQSLLENYHRSMQAVQVFDREGNATGFFEYDSSSANKCLELLGRMIGAYTDRVDATVAHKGVVVLPSNGTEINEQAKTDLGHSDAERDLPPGGEASQEPETP